MKRNETGHSLPSGEAGEPRTQFGALCWRLHRGGVDVLLITSRDTGRWVIPKGWPMAGKTAEESAAQEAWEEAGVRGEAGTVALGLYAYDKMRKGRAALPCLVQVFPLRVAALARRFPERQERRRRWFRLARAAQMVDEPELRALLAQLGVDAAPLTGGAGTVASD